MAIEQALVFIKPDGIKKSLTGNVLMKMFSSFTSGGSFETVGFGYGPGIGFDYDKLVLILSRASGAPVVANSILFAGELVKGEYKKITKCVFDSAKKAGLDALVKSSAASSVNSTSAAKKEVKAPKEEVVTAEISGIEIADLDTAAELLWSENIYASTGMGCTGPIVLVSEKNKPKAVKILTDKGFISG